MDRVSKGWTFVPDKQLLHPMKKLYAFLMLLLPFFAIAQTPTKTISGNITSNYTFHNDTIYILDGFVFVKNNATLSIEPGTIVKAVKATRSTLVVTMGSKINADGTKARPIVFTSNETAGNRSSGDWGGIVILGKNIINRPADCTTCPGTAVAATLEGNQNAIEGDIDNVNGDGLYGGALSNDNSGILRYVRIEFAGVVITTGNEINGLTLGAVGNGTTIEHVQVNQSNDDAFEWFGGNVNCKYLVSTGAIDDDFDTDFGFSGKIQFAVAQRDSFNYDTGSSPTTNGFESDNDGAGSYAGPRTSAVFSNVTMVGPAASSSLSDPGSFQNAARLRRNTTESLFNSVFIGFPTGILIDGAGTTTAYLNDTLLLKNNIVAGALGRNITTNQAAEYSNVITKFMAQGNDTSDTFAGLLNDPFNYTNPDWKPSTGSTANNGAAFTGSLISDAFFSAVTFRGAFGTEDWTACWTEFDPNNQPYTSPINLNPSADFTSSSVGLEATFANTSSSSATSYSWNFGDAGTSTETSPSHTYNAEGTYTVTLIAFSACGSDTTTSDITVVPVGIENINALAVQVRPNPATENAQLSFSLSSASETLVEVLDITGKRIDLVYSGTLNQGNQTFSLSTVNYTSGIYLVRINTEKAVQTVRLVVSK